MNQMNEINQLNKAKGILNQVLSATFYSLNNNKSGVQEARSHIKQAIDKLEKIAKKEAAKEAAKKAPQNNDLSPHQNWIQNINTYYQVGTVGLKKIEELIQAEKDKLDELEKKSQSIDTDDIILD